MSTPGREADIEVDREVIREHLRTIMNDKEISTKDRLSAMSMLGKDAGMWKESDNAGSMSLQVLIADLRGQRTIEVTQPAIPTLRAPDA